MKTSWICIRRLSSSRSLNDPNISTRIEVGRQQIAVGSGRLYALREGPNVPLSFDGVRAIAQTESWRFDAWAGSAGDDDTGDIRRLVAPPI